MLHKWYFFYVYFTVRRYVSTIYAVVVCLSVCLSENLNVGSRKQRHTIP